jgi:uncharacterized protein with HEPN domain
MDAIESIEAFTKDLSEEEFMQDSKICSAVLFQFVIIGEAVSALSLELMQKYPYAWHKPRSFRNFIAHEYFGIKMEVVWYTIQVQLPEFKSFIIEIRNS